MKKLFSSIVIVISIILSGILYRNSFTGYFFQDDWFSFSISKVQNIRDFLNFFIPRTDVIYYRPLGMQVPFFLMRTFFGLNPLPYHLLIFITHAINIFLVYTLLTVLTRNSNSALFGAFLYSTSSFHYIPFYWFATFSFILGPTFFFLTFIYFFKFLEDKKKLSMYVLLFFYVLGIFTNELVLMFFPMIVVFYLIHLNRYKYVLIRPILLVGLLTFCLFLFRFVYKPPTNGAYAVQIGKHIVTNLKTYLLWSFNWPEEMKAQFINFFRINPEFIRNFSTYYYVFIITFIILLLLMFGIPVIAYIYMKKRKNTNLIIFGFAWFVIGIIPVLLFEGHSFAYYLPISFVGLCTSSLLLIQSIWNSEKNFRFIKSLYFITIILSWILVSFTAIEFNSRIHWAPRRSQIAKEFVQKALLMYPDGYKGIYTFYIHSTSENKHALNNQDGLKEIFNNALIKTIYGSQAGNYTL